MAILILVLAFFASLIPAVALFFWLRNLQHDESFKTLGNKALGAGALCVFPIVLCSAVLSLVGLILRIAGMTRLPYVFFYKFIAIAFSEELVKYLCLGRVVRRNERAYSWLDIIILMTFIGIGFGLAEDLVYAFSTNAIQMLVRGIDIGHGGYGFIMGYFVGKGMKTGKKGYTAFGFLLPWFLHGLYDFTLSEEVLALHEDVALIPVSLALLSVVTIIVLIFFARKARNDDRYTEPLPSGYTDHLLLSERFSPAKPQFEDAAPQPEDATVPSEDTTPDV